MLTEDTLSTKLIGRSKYEIAGLIRDVLRSEAFPPGEYTRLQIAEKISKMGIIEAWEIPTNLNRVAITAGWVPNGGTRASARVVKLARGGNVQDKGEEDKEVARGGAGLRLERIERMLDAICRELNINVEKK